MITIGLTDLFLFLPQFHLSEDHVLHIRCSSDVQDVQKKVACTVVNNCVAIGVTEVTAYSSLS